MQLLEQLAITARNPGCGCKHALFERRVVKGMEEQLEFAGVALDPRVECERVLRGKFVHFQRQQGPPVVGEFSRPDPDHRQAGPPGENGVELRDAAGPGIQVVTSNAVDQKGASGISAHSTATWRGPQDARRRFAGPWLVPCGPRALQSGRRDAVATPRAPARHTRRRRRWPRAANRQARRSATGETALLRRAAAQEQSRTRAAPPTRASAPVRRKYRCES